VPRRLHGSADARARVHHRAGVELERDGLASATAERMVAGDRTIEVARVRITEAGRRALAE
jgi:hypothetical protein